jgi:hypothetical protein
MARRDVGAHAVSLGLGALYPAEPLRVLLPKRAFYLDGRVQDLMYAFQRYGRHEQLARILVCEFEDHSILQIYYDVLNYRGRMGLKNLLLSIFKTILSKSAVASLKRDLLKPSKNPLAEAMKLGH